MAGFGVRNDDIATYLGITEKTLVKYYKEELATGAIRANATIAKTLFQKAKDGDTTACIFWLKTRAGWRETQKVELTGADGGAVNVKQKYDFSALSVSEGMELAALIAKTRKTDKNAANNSKRP